MEITKDAINGTFSSNNFILQSNILYEKTHFSNAGIYTGHCFCPGW